MIKVVLILSDCVLDFHTDLTLDAIRCNVSSALQGGVSQNTAIHRLYRRIPHCAPNMPLQGIYRVDFQDQLVTHSYQEV